MTAGSPFDDFRAVAASLRGPDGAAEDRLRRVFSSSREGLAGLGQVAGLALWLARWSSAGPVVRRPQMAVFAGTHGVAALGVGDPGGEPTDVLVEGHAAGGTVLNQVCAANDLGLKVFDLALHLPTADMTREPALDERACAATMAFGMEAVAGGTDLLCIGSLGVGGATVAAAIFAALYGGGGADWVDGEGDADLSRRRIAAVDAAVAVHAGHLADPLEVLRRFGGREFAAIAGAILAARAERVPVVLDGCAALAAAAVLARLAPTALDHCLLAQRPVRDSERRVAAALAMKPILDLDMHADDGRAAAIAAGLVRTVAQLAGGMAEIAGRRVAGR